MQSKDDLLFGFIVVNDLNDIPFSLYHLCDPKIINASKGGSSKKKSKPHDEDDSGDVELDQLLSFKVNLSIMF